MEVEVGQGTAVCKAARAQQEDIAEGRIAATA